ncbi:hypothetical protein [Halopelagius fulvigenes]|uniref:Uncharacterized protein n=1 Tax=Halopelagius fulvigenes TaxID=1198324 RepID=A0ABD5TW15_9EURY
MNAPTRADDAADDGRGGGSEESSLENAVSDVSSHYKAVLFAAGSFAVAYWSAFVRPEMSPKWYVPIMVTFALGALGYVYLAEHSTLRLGTTRAEG